jgi:hypothetical protein
MNRALHCLGLVMAAGCGWAGSPLRAELPLESYAYWQQAAAEAVTVDVLETRVVRTRLGAETHCEVRAVARVAAVERSQAGLRPGQRIVILYETVERAIPQPGPSPTPVLSAGKTHPAFLKRAGQGAAFAPAAQGYSFDRVAAGVAAESSKVH